MALNMTWSREFSLPDLTRFWMDGGEFLEQCLGLGLEDPHFTWPGLGHGLVAGPPRLGFLMNRIRHTDPV